ncbi:hypothetical protein QVG61_11390 [Thiohalobacter sp. IOR34]|uniref:hypothetical protein n=1 Tax=Thiohalobacter sp. IOR34 TaxID=3057176 RepID=UPI0025AF95B9|nr:hypothetical protein [Thiohalobacter sp. IOR34]WJW75087.1 hypothetical protein QVG61_11390 [Thiohalobacter sp. IOR34]
MWPVCPEARGAATLVMALGLILAVGILAFAVAHTGVTEQRMADNRLRAAEALQAAEAGLDFGRNWLRRGRPRWLPAGGTQEIAAPGRNPPRLQAGNGDSFGVNLGFRRDRRQPHYIRILSSAQAAHAPEVRARVRQTVRLFSVLTPAGEQAPPLITGNCPQPASGPLHIFPRNADRPAAGPALASAASGPCPRQGLRLHGGGLLPAAFPRGRLWQHLFAIDRAALRALAETERRRGLADNRRRYWWARPGDLAGGIWRRNLGSPQQPVVLVFPARLGCPRLAAGVVIHGLVFVDGDCPPGAPWGPARIYGTLAVAGNMARLGRDLRLLHIEQASGRPAALALPVLEVAPVPGSWSDL